MKQRCYNPNNLAYKNYGGRGIKICPQWLEPKVGFNQFLLDMGEKPFGFSIERINNNGNYEPTNCKWASRKEQQRNQSVTRKIVIEGIEYIASDLSDISGLKTDSIVQRAKYGLTYNEIINPQKRVFTEGLSLGGKASGAKKQALTHCKYGHEFTLKNTSITKQGWRRCKACRHKK
jgi:hypothetical protein